MKKSLLIIGHIPPPFGGVAVHIARLVANIKKVCDVDVVDESSNIKQDVFNLRSLHLRSYFKKIRKADIVHIHSSDWRLRIFHMLAARLFRKRIIITLHSFRANAMVQKITRSFLNKADDLIFVSKNIQEALGFTDDDSQVQEGFIPPPLDDEQPLPEYLMNELSKAREQDAAVLVSNASRLDDHDGNDLYGLDLAIDLVEHLAVKRNVICIFIVNSLQKHADKFHHFQRVFMDKGLEANFLLLYENLSFPLLMQHADVVLRLTNTDGDSLTIREALHFGIVPVASDVVPRPFGTVLFHNRDLNDLIAQVELVLDAPPKLEKNLDNPLDFYHHLYQIELTDQAE